MSENKQFKVVETKKHDNKKIYELTNNDISFYNFREEKLLANMICNELNKRIDEIEQLKRKKEWYKRLSEIRDENINNRILSLKEFINNCEDEKVKNILEDFFYSEVKEYDLAKENRKLKKENEQLKKENTRLKKENRQLRGR